MADSKIPVEIEVRLDERSVGVSMDALKSRVKAQGRELGQLLSSAVHFDAPKSGLEAFQKQINEIKQAGRDRLAEQKRQSAELMKVQMAYGNEYIRYLKDQHSEALRLDKEFNTKRAQMAKLSQAADMGLVGPSIPSNVVKQRAEQAALAYADAHVTAYKAAQVKVQQQMAKLSQAADMGLVGPSIPSSVVKQRAEQAALAYADAHVMAYKTAQVKIQQQMAKLSQEANMGLVGPQIPKNILAARELQESIGLWGHLEKRLRGIALLTTELTRAFFGLSLAVGAVGAPAIFGVKYLKDIEDAKMGMAGALVTMGKFSEGADKFSTVMGVADNVIQGLEKSSVKFGVPLTDIVGTFRAVVSSGLQAGMTLEEVGKAATIGAVAVKSLGLNSTQVVQELRDLFMGGIQPASSTLATSLGLRDSDIKKAKADAEAGIKSFYDFMMEKLAGYELVAANRAGTLSGAFDVLQIKAQRLFANDGVFQGVKDIVKQISDAIGTVNQETGEIKFSDGALESMKIYNRLVEDAISLTKMVVGFVIDYGDALVKLGSSVAVVAMIGAAFKASSVAKTFALSQLALMKKAYAEVALAAEVSAVAQGAAMTSIGTKATTVATGTWAALSAVVGKTGLMGMALFAVYEVADMLGWIDAVFGGAVKKAKDYAKEMSGMSVDASKGQLSEIQKNMKAITDLVGDPTESIDKVRMNEKGQIISDKEYQNLSKVSQETYKLVGARTAYNELLKAEEYAKEQIANSTKNQMRLEKDATLTASKYMDEQLKGGFKNKEIIEEQYQAQVKIVELNKKGIQREFDQGSFNYDSKKTAEENASDLAAVQENRLKLLKRFGDLEVHLAKERDDKLAALNKADPKVARSLKDSLQAQITGYNELTEVEQANLRGKQALIDAQHSVGQITDENHAQMVNEIKLQEALNVQAQAGVKYAFMASNAQVFSKNEIAKAHADLAEAAAKSDAAQMQADARSLKATKEQKEALDKLVASYHEAGASAYEEAEAQMLLGKNATLTAEAYYRIAEAKLKSRGIDITQEIEDTLRQAAAVKALGEAYKTVAKIHDDVMNDIQQLDAESVMMFVETEKQKAQIAFEKDAKILDSTIARIEAQRDAEVEYQRSMGVEDQVAIDRMNKVIEDTYKTKEALSERYNKQIRNAELKDAKETVDKLEGTFKELFVGMASSGGKSWKDMLKKFQSSFKTDILEYIYKQLAKPFVLNVIASVTGAMGFGSVAQAAENMAGGAGGAGGLMNTASTASNLYSAGSNLYDVGSQFFGGTMSASNAAGTIYANATKTGIDGLLSTNGAFGTAPGAGGSLGSAMPVIGGALAAYGLSQKHGVAGGMIGGAGSVAIGGAISGAMAGTGAMAGATGALAAMGPWGWAAIAIMSILGSMNKAKVPKANFINADMEGWTQIATPFGPISAAAKHMKSGDFNKMVDGVRPIADADKLLTAFMTPEEVAAASEKIKGQGTGEVKAKNASGAIQGFLEERLDLITDAIGGWVNALADTAEGELKDVYAQTASILAARKMVGAETLANSLLDESGKEFFRETETAASAFARMATALGTVNPVLEQINVGVLAMTASAGNAATDLLKAFGGVDKFQQSTSAYYQNFFSDAERAEVEQRKLKGAVYSAFAEFGAQVPKTRAEFRELVESLDVTTESGQKAFVALMDVSGAFAAITVNADAAVAAERKAVIEGRRAKEAAAQASVDVVTEATKGLRDSVAKNAVAASGVVGGVKLTAGEYEEFAPFAEALTVARTELAKVPAEMTGAINAIEQQITETVRMMGDQLSSSRLLQGDAKGALEALMAGVRINPSQYTNDDGEFVASGLNRAMMFEQVRMAMTLMRQASVNALDIEDVGTVMSSLAGVFDSQEFQYAITRQITDGAGVAWESAFRTGIEASGGLSFLTKAQISKEYGVTGPGLLAVRNAQAAVGFAHEIDQNLDRLYDRAIEVAKITSNYDDIEDAIGSVNILFEDYIGLLHDEAAQKQMIVDANRSLMQSGIESIGFYFGQISEKAKELNEAAREAGEPIAKVSSAIGRLNSMTTVFSESVSAVMNGATGSGTYIDSQTQGQLDKAKLISDAAQISSKLMTTADAAEAAKRLSDQFSGDQRRDASMLLSGLQEYDSDSFEKAFLRINDALIKNVITNSQYEELFKLATRIFTGADAQQIDIQNRLADAARDAASNLESIIDILDRGIKSLWKKVDQTAMLEYQQSVKFLNDALTAAQETGAMPDRDKLSSAVDSIVALDSKGFKTKTDADRERLIQAGRMEQLKNLASDQLTLQERMLQVSEFQLTQLQGINGSMTDFVMLGSEIKDLQIPGESVTPSTFDSFGIVRAEPMYTSENVNAIDLDALIAELRALRDDQQIWYSKQDAQMVSIVVNTKKTAKILEAVTPDGTSVSTV